MCGDDMTEDLRTVESIDRAFSSDTSEYILLCLRTLWQSCADAVDLDGTEASALADFIGEQALRWLVSQDIITIVGRRHILTLAGRRSIENAAFVNQSVAKFLRNGDSALPKGHSAVLVAAILKAHYYGSLEPQSAHLSTTPRRATLH